MVRGGLLGPRPDPTDPIRIGFQIWEQAVAWPDLMAAGERIEALGFASLFANDHFMPILGDADGPVVGIDGPVFEGWMTLAGVGRPHDAGCRSGSWSARSATATSDWR